MAYKDIGKSRERGSREFKSHVVEKTGNVMLMAEEDVVTTSPTNSIKNVAKLMKENDFRRIPIVDAGTNRLEGLAVAIDILDFLGGGEKYNIIQEDYDGNFLSAINCPISKIKEDAMWVEKTSQVEEVVDVMMEKRTSAIPLVNDKEEKTVIGIVTERDVLPESDELGITVGEAMETDVITSSLGMRISDVSKIMVRNRLRRLPVIKEGKLIGVVTVFDVLEFLGYGEFKDLEVQGKYKAEDILDEKVEKIMEEEVLSVSKDQDLAEICNMIRETGVGGFPVAENDELKGIITTSDVIREIY